MLYRPKFCRPSLTDAEQKCFKSLGSNGNSYTFSCVCDGDEKIERATLSLYDTDGTVIFDNKETDSNLPLYPINNKGEYNIIEFSPMLSPEEAVFTNNRSVFWMVTLYGEERENNEGESIQTMVTSFMQETFIANPSIIWKDADDNTIENHTVETPELINTNKIHIKSGLTNYPYKIQYWYYKVYENNTNTLVYESKKIFSQDIDFTFDQFINQLVYRVELYIMDTVNQEWKTENYFQSNYDIYESSASLNSKLMPFDNGVYLQWDNISMNIADGTKETISLIEETNSQGTIINTQQVYQFCGNNPLTIDNVNLYTRGIYGCIRIPEYNQDNNNYCHFFVYDDNKNLINPSAQLLITRESANNLTFKTSTYTGGNLELNNENSPAWVVFYWDFATSKVAVKLLQSDNLVSMTINGMVKNGIVLSSGLYKNPSGILNPQIPIEQAITLNKLAINGVGTQMAYLFAVKPDSDEITIEEEEGILKLKTNILSQLNTLNTQPFWNYGLAALNKVEPEDENKEVEITGNNNYSDLANKFVFCLNFENYDLYKDSQEKWHFAEKEPLLLGDPIYKQTVKQMIVKRKEEKENYFKTIATLDYDYNKSDSSQLQLIDYGAKSGKKYQYVLFPVGETQQYQGPIYSDPIEVDWEKWTLMLCDETENENELTVDQIFLFDLNIKSGSMSNNNKKTLIENFTPYPRVQSSQSCYWSGSLTGLLGYIAQDNMTYIQTPEMLQIFKNLSRNRQRKFLKDRDGNLFEVEISSALSIENTDNLTIDLKTKKIDWAEVADAENTSIILKSNQVPVWLESSINSGAVGRNEINWLQKNYWIGDL